MTDCELGASRSKAWGSTIVVFAVTVCWGRQSLISSLPPFFAIFSSPFIPTPLHSSISLPTPLKMSNAMHLNQRFVSIRAVRKSTSQYSDIFERVQDEEGRYCSMPFACWEGKRGEVRVGGRQTRRWIIQQVQAEGALWRCSLIRWCMLHILYTQNTCHQPHIPKKQLSKQ